MFSSLLGCEETPGMP